MRIRILGIGRVREPFYRDGIDFYAKRLRSYCQLEVVEVAKERSGAVKDLESAYSLLRKRYLSDSVRVVLDQGGETLSSEELADWLNQVIRDGVNGVSFVLGGPHGLPDLTREDSTQMMSLSAMTLPHQMARLLLLEQIYRGFTILRGEPYHR